jgi:hypothetical protein
MRIAIATHSLLLVAELSDTWELCDLTVLERGYHYGMALKTGPSGEPQLLVYRGGKSDAEQDEMELRIYDRADLRLLSSRPLDDSFGAVHQIAWANQGLYVANTKKNRLDYLAEGWDSRSSYTFGGVEGDIHHVNSVFPCGPDLLTVLHNRHQRESELAILRHQPDAGLTLHRKLPLWDVCCHNIFVDGRYLLYNASTARRLVVADLAASRVLHRIGFGGHHTKALAVTPSHILVGLSEHTVRRRRRFSEGFLAVLDRQSFKTTAVIDLNRERLPQPLGNINEIRCLDGQEEAHASGPLALDWSSVPLARSTPAAFWAFRLMTRGLIPLRRVKQSLLSFVRRQ